MKNTSTSTSTKPSSGALRKPLSEVQKTNPESQKELTFEELYVKKDYKGAAQYLLDNKKQFDSGIFHYNLGTVYSKLGDQAAARFHLEKAIGEGYINSSSLNNLNFVRSKLSVDDLTTSESIPDRLINLSSALPSAAYVSLTLIFLIITVIFLKIKFIQKKWITILLLFLSFSPLMYLRRTIKNIS